MVILKTVNHWKWRRFNLGLNVISEIYYDYRDYYISISLGFWQVVLGIRL